MLPCLAGTKGPARKQGTFLAHVSRSLMSDCLRGFQQNSPLLPEEQGQSGQGEAMCRSRRDLRTSLASGGAGAGRCQQGCRTVAELSLQSQQIPVRSGAQPRENCLPRTAEGSHHSLSISIQRHSHLAKEKATLVNIGRGDKST